MSDKSKITYLEKSRRDAQERKRIILHLIRQYLFENNYTSTAECFNNEALLNESGYKVCENIDLDIILQEYQSYYYSKFQKHQKVLHKLSDEEKSRKSSSISKKTTMTSKIQVESDKNKNPDNFHFEIMSFNSIAECEEKQDVRIDEKCELEATIQSNIILKSNNYNWNDCIGLENAAENLKEAILYPLKYPELFSNNSIISCTGILLYGPPGTGKTLLAKTLACEGLTPFINVTASCFISKWRGESEKLVKALFDVAQRNSPATIFIDELDAITPNCNEVMHEASKRFRSEFLTQIDGITENNGIFVLAATNSPWNIDAAVLRRFEKRIFIGPPQRSDQIVLFKYFLKDNAKYLKNDELESLVKECENFTGADIKIVCKEASLIPIREKIKNIGSGNKKNSAIRPINIDDLKKAISRVKPCCGEKEIKKYYEWTEKYGFK